MAAQKGRLLVLKFGSDILSTARTNTLTINNETVDVTAKDTNGYRDLIADAGIRSVDLSVSGILKDVTAEETLAGYANDGTINTVTIEFESGETYEGDFQVSAFTVTGEHNGATTYDATLLSSGEVVRTPAP